jgi:hypothetical protein
MRVWMAPPTSSDTPTIRTSEEDGADDDREVFG